MHGFFPVRSTKVIDLRIQKSLGAMQLQTRGVPIIFTIAKQYLGKSGGGGWGAGPSRYAHVIQVHVSIV